MKKRYLKLLTVFMSLLFVATSLMGLYGCGRFGNKATEQVDSTKTQLYVGAFGGGIGVNWLENLKIRFEDYYKDESFEEGKKGVQVFYREDKDKYNARALVTQIAYDSNEIFFVTSDELDKFLAGNHLLEITDIVTEKLTKYGETRSIEDKMYEVQKNHHKRDGKYYSLPDNQTSLGLIYDIELFEDKGLYFAKNGAPSERLQPGGSFSTYKYAGGSDAKSAGPDGKYNTFDDGLPATLEEFNNILKRMENRGVDALVWTGQYADTYTSFLPWALKIDYHGQEESMVTYHCGKDGGTNVRVIESFDKDGQPVVTEKMITPENYNETAKMAGNYYGLKLIDDIVAGGHASAYSFQALSHVRTQDKFLVSSYRFGERPIAMMIEGTWWENEAEVSGIFKDNVVEFGESASKENRKFGFMPMPKVSEEHIGEKSTIDGGMTSCFISSKIDPKKAKAAKAFLQFSCTDESLCQFTVDTGIPKSFVYDMPEKELDKLTVFARQYWHVNKNADKIYGYIPQDIANNTSLNSDRFKITMYFADDPTGRSYSLFVTEVKYNNLTAKEYFEGMYREVKRP